MSANSTTVSSGVSPPLTTDNNHNHSGLIVVITAFNLCLVLFSVAARTFSSYHRNSLQRDDYTFGALVVQFYTPRRELAVLELLLLRLTHYKLAAICQIVIVFCQVHYGWGTPIGGIETTSKEQMLKVSRLGYIEFSRIVNNSKIVYVADIFSILVLGLSKMTTCLFYEGLFFQMQHRLSFVILLVMIAWTILSAFLLGIRCSSSPWSEISATECSGLVCIASTETNINTDLATAYPLGSHYSPRHFHRDCTSFVCGICNSQSQDLDQEKNRRVLRSRESDFVGSFTKLLIQNIFC